MKNQFLFVSISLFLGVITTFAQKKTLTLADAVSQQYRSLAAKNMVGFAWIPGTVDDYSYLEAYQTLVIVSTTTTKVGSIKIQEINTACKAELNWFSGFSWLDENTFYVTDGINYYKYNVATKLGSKWLNAPENAENVNLNEASGNIAYTIENNLYVKTGSKQMAITNEKPGIVSGAAIARSEFGITGGIFWAQSGKSIAFYQKNERLVAEYPLLDINAPTGKLKSIRYPMAGQTSETPRVGIMKIGSKKPIYIDTRNGKDNYLTNVSWSSDEKFIILAEVNRDQNQFWVNKYDAATGKFLATLFEEKNDKWAEPEHSAFFFSKVSNDFIWISERDGYNNLYLYDINGTLKKQLTSNKFVVKSIVEGIESDKIYFTATGVDPKNTHLFSVDLSGNQTQLTKTDGVHANLMHPKGNLFFDQYSNITTPNVAQICSIDNKPNKELLTAPNPLTDYAIGTVEFFKIKSVDAQDLHGRIIKPSNFDASKKYPVLCYVYGGPHAQMVTNEFMGNVDYWMLWMAEQGYIVYTLDNRGSGERGTAFEQVIHRQLGTSEISDQMQAVEYLKTLPFIDMNRIAVHGWSFGGFMTTSLLLKEANTFKVGVAGGPVTDWKYYEIMYGERYMDRPQENEKGYEQASTLTHADKLKGKLLLIHGTIDDVVVMQHSEALIKKFVEVDKQMDFFVYPMHEHNVRGKDRIHLMTKVLNYILENNK
jgi:dipeptidyl-peptidase 4